jgi:hypothetical protein
VVTGFKSDEFSSVMGEGYCVVRQSHAHAWVEVLTMDGWKTYDPTSGTEAATKQNTGFLQSIKHLFDYMEYTWGASVVAYDSGRRDNLINKVENRLTNTAINHSGNLSRWRLGVPGVSELLLRFRGASSYLSGALILVILLAILGALAQSALKRWRIYRRAMRMGLDGLPRPDQMRLAQQLGFYEDMLRLLERQGIRRERNQTPLEFSRSLSFLPSEVYDAVRRLTRIFYRVRFGRAQVRGSQQRRLALVVARLESKR